MFAFLAAHRGDVFPDADYADLSAPPGVGRPSLPAARMAAVLTLQVLHDYSDRETAEAARFDVRWKVAIGAPLDDPGFDPSSLVYWRNRIAKSQRPHRISDAVKKVVQETGVLTGRRRRAVDSTILADAVATQDTVTQLVSTIRRVARVVPGAAEQIAAVCTGHDYTKPGKPAIDWDDPAAKDALVSALVNDANAIVAAFADAELDEPAALVYCPFRALLHLPTWSDKRRVFDRVAAALAPGGRFVWNSFVFNPRIAAENDGKWDVQHGIRHRVDHFPADNRLDITLESGGSVSLWWVTKSEWEGLVDVSGLEVEALYGDFERTPFDEQSGEFVWVARKPL
jgi:hypothetical protein